jgi:hypothetical protein
MGQRALFIVLVLVVVVGLFAYFGYNSYDAKRAGLNGDVFLNDSSGGKTKLGPVSRAESTSGEPMVIYPAPAGQAVQTVPVTPETVQNGAETTQREVASGDTISANPPNGTVFAGRGKYQLYRQGDLTWRLNTETGQTCIIFATDEEWRKPKVYRAGCGAR